MEAKKTGAFIAARRKELQMTQRQLGEELGISDKTVSKIEKKMADRRGRVYALRKSFCLFFWTKQSIPAGLYGNKHLIQTKGFYPCEEQRTMV